MRQEVLVLALIQQHGTMPACTFFRERNSTFSAPTFFILCLSVCLMLCAICGSIEEIFCTGIISCQVWKLLRNRLFLLPSRKNICENSDCISLLKTCRYTYKLKWWLAWFPLSTLYWLSVKIEDRGGKVISGGFFSNNNKEKTFSICCRAIKGGNVVIFTSEFSLELC